MSSVFHGPEHLTVDSETGRIVRRVSIVTNVPLRKHVGSEYETVRVTLPTGKNKRCVIQSSNLLVGDYHYFRSYTHPFVGRVNLRTSDVEYLQLPVQLMRTADEREDHFLWDAADVPVTERKKGRKKLAITQWSFRPNEMKNSRGFVVMGDKRSRGNGWGHHASAVPTVCGDHLFIPTMSGTVYVLAHDSATLDERSIVAINDLGPIGKSWNRASLSFAHGCVFAHTIREVICIGK